MRKILYFTDTHLQGKELSSRKDNFFMSILEKIEEIGEIANSINVDYVLFGGDWFSHPSPSDEVIIKLIQALKKFNARPIISILGNHDIEGRNPETYNRKSAKILEEAGVVKFLKDGEVFPPVDMEIEIHGINYRDGVDENPDFLRIKKRNINLIAIEMVHSYVLPFKANFSCLSLEEVAGITEADIILVGHYHDGYGIRRVDGKIFISPGSIARDSITQFDRIPQVVLLTIKNTKVEPKLIKLKRVKKREEIERKNLDDIDRVLFGEFFSSLTERENRSFDPERIIEMISKDEKVDDEVKREALRRYEEARERIYKKS